MRVDSSAMYCTLKDESLRDACLYTYEEAALSDPTQPCLLQEHFPSASMQRVLVVTHRTFLAQGAQKI
jgi:hypothetical protein